jgi:hypothetical protein
MQTHPGEFLLQPYSLTPQRSTSITPGSDNVPAVAELAPTTLAEILLFSQLG